MSRYITRSGVERAYAGVETPSTPDVLDVVGASGPMPLKSKKSMCTKYEEST
jgi:hypothetical protein